MKCARVVFLSLLVGVGCEFLKRSNIALEPSEQALPELPPKKTAPEVYVLGVFAPGSFLLGLGAVVLLRYYERHNPSSDMEIVERQPENLDEDVYGAGIATLVRDSFSLVDGKGDIFLRVSRLSSSIVLMIFVISLQIFVILQMQSLVASRAVTEIRQIYGRYEFVMYGAEMTHVYLTPNGFPRGADKQYFDPANFGRLTEDEQSSACRIPFSQPQLLLPILFIWTLTVVADLRRCGDLFVRLILATPTITSMRDAVVESDGECEIIVGLTRSIKVLLMSTCVLPRYFINVYLLWLGCRWLAATPSFGDLLLNAVALEFILLLKDTLYAGVVPDRNKRATQNTLIQPWQKTEPANYRVFLSSFLLILVTCAWVLYYVYKFQAVLPDYKWDVAQVCAA
ncbi:Uncharacterized protein SCF082_LOCUS27657 [Durusdinium trenchii]|uniref:Uncharacterized protein n=1 Tax=Durusdinium trenchii TaxID=1381693 RepID=A0ABP0MF27_9DINO